MLIHNSKFLIFVLILIFISGCGSIDSGEIPGKYLGKHGIGEDILEIKTDGTYIHSYRANPEAKLITSIGIWSFESSGITLQGYEEYLGLHDLELNKELEQPHFHTASVKKSFFSNRIKLHFGGENNPDYYFEKE